ncbi:MAG: hypothetical protein KC613_17535, partial [Myxococcales bacterium]|nr:hypothetical protein [Myxococcales bacterium]
PATEAPIPDMAPRHRPRELREAFAAALQAEQGQVIDIDCEELPCVLYGQVKDFADTVRLFSAEPLAPYRTDRRFIYRWNVGGGSDGAPAERRFAIALMPRNIPDDQMELARESVLRRYRQVRQQPATAQR